MSVLVSHAHAHHHHAPAHMFARADEKDVLMDHADAPAPMSPMPMPATPPSTPVAARKRQASAPLVVDAAAAADVVVADASNVTAAAASGVDADEAILRDPRQRYTLHKELHQSIFGKVYMATDNATGRSVALKVSVRRLLDLHVSMNGVKVLENPLAEVDMMDRVKGHPNVVSLVALHEDSELHWMAQEFVPGGELFDALAASHHGHFTEEQARSAFRQLLAGVSHIHSQGVAHLDLSLENLLLDLDGTIKICDFGLARSLESGRKFRNNGENRPGKLGYMAPEVLAGDDFDGVKADVFSAGVILFTLLTGHPPFEYASLKDKRFEMIARGQMLEMLRLLRMNHRVPLPAADLISRMLHPNPEKRISVEEIARHPWLQVRD